MNNAVYWIWLTNAIGYNSPKQKRIFELYANIENFYNGGEKEWRFSGVFSDSDLSKLKLTKLESSNEIIKKCLNLGYSIITFDSEEYPKSLFNIYAPPSVIYVNGELPDMDNRLSIAVVGSRTPKEYGLRHSYNFAYNLAKSGATIVSGGALGIDCASHRGALNAHGVTVCVLGCGINYKYLMENEKMRRDITYKGAVISEYPPDTAPRPYFFPARNRIISALSDGVFVIEAGPKSGSLITANCAIEQGKQVFALMASADSISDKGSNNLIKQGGAVPVTEFTDIINEFDNVYVTKEIDDVYEGSSDEIEVIPIKGTPPKKLNNKKTKVLSVDNSVQTDNIIEHRKNLNLNETEQMVYDFINTDAVHIDEISLKLKIKVFKLLPVLTKLEIMGLIKNEQGRRYKLI